MLCCTASALPVTALVYSLSDTQAFILHRSESPVLAYSPVHFRAHRTSSSRTACQRARRAPIPWRWSDLAAWRFVADSILKTKKILPKHNLALRGVRHLFQG
jgi:hypothetical protein